MSEKTRSVKFPENPDARAAARWYVEEAGLRPIPVPAGSKGPNTSGWQNLVLGNREEVDAHFPEGADLNVGILLQPDLVDCDVDADEARRLSNQFEFLPPTGWISGRASAPRSHRWYRCPEPEYKKYLDPVRPKGKHACLVEIRTGKQQTLVPPSTHPSGEAIVWDSITGEPPTEECSRLKTAVERLAAAALLVRYFPGDGARHDLAMHLVGGLAHGGWGLDEAEWFVRAVATAAGDPETKDRLRCVRDTFERFEAGDPVTGWPSVTEVLPEPVVRRLREWLGMGNAGDQPQPTSELPRIEVTTLEAQVNAQAVAALAADTHLYQRGGALVHVILTSSIKAEGSLRRGAGTPQIVPLPQALLRESLAAYARFFRSTDDGPTLVHPPGWCVQAVHARGQWPGIRHLEGVVDAPVLRPDGTVLRHPGYDAATGLLYLPGGAPPDIPDHPSPEQVREALKLLRDLVADFPFDKEVHGAAWLAFLLTPLARHAFDGPAPLTLIGANVAGSGKGLLAGVAAIIATGRDLSVSVQSGDDDEMRKSITSAVKAGDRLIVLDNVVGTLGCPALDAALTCTRWRDRQLGSNSLIDLAMDATWCATGNNVVLKGDLARRVLHVRLNSPEEHPEDRTGFRHPELKAYAREHRTELLGAALTILRGYWAAGRPDQGLSPWGSYEGWSSVVRNALVWAGVPDPAETRGEVRRTCDPEAAALPALLAGIEFLDPQGKGLTVGQILEKIGAGKGPAVAALRDALATLCPRHGNDALAGPQSVGMTLHHLLGRVVGDRWLERLPETRNGARWRVGRRDQGGECGTSGTSGTTPPRSHSGAGDGNGDPAGAGSSPASTASPAGGGMGSASTAFYELLKARGQQRRQAGAKGN
jgi:hypothetical protein